MLWTFHKKASIYTFSSFDLKEAEAIGDDIDSVKLWNYQLISMKIEILWHQY